MAPKVNSPRAWIVVLCLVCPLLAFGADKGRGDKDKPTRRHDVSITGNLQYSPATLRIHPGETVVWTNNDDRDHTVVANDGSFRSGNIKSGQTYEFTFSKVGKFSYGCSYHPRMKATIVVEQ